MKSQSWRTYTANPVNRNGKIAAQNRLTIDTLPVMAMHIIEANKESEEAATQAPTVKPQNMVNARTVALTLRERTELTVRKKLTMT